MRTMRSSSEAADSLKYTVQWHCVIVNEFTKCGFIVNIPYTCTYFYSFFYYNFIAVNFCVVSIKFAEFINLLLLIAALIRV